MASIRASRICDNRLSARARVSRIRDHRPVSVKVLLEMCFSGTVLLVLLKAHRGSTTRKSDPE